MSMIAAIQMNSGADVGANLETAARLLREAAAAGARLAVLPENFAFMGERDRDKLAHAEADGQGLIQDTLSALARELDLWIVAGTLPITAGTDAEGHARVYAACCVYDSDGARVARYDKIHLFDIDVPGSGERYRESSSIAPGRVHPVVVDTPVGRVGLSVCYDLRFPELYRALVDAGAEILVVPAAFTVKTGEAHWHLLLRRARSRTWSMSSRPARAARIPVAAAPTGTA